MTANICISKLIPESMSQSFEESLKKKLEEGRDSEVGVVTFNRDIYLQEVWVFRDGEFGKTWMEPEPFGM